jgi:hypothetical protein
MFATKSAEPQHKKTGASSSQTHSASPDYPLRQLHETLGNQVVQRLYKSGLLQAKLGIGKPGDRFEQEADRVADQVMRLPEPLVQMKPG